MLKLECENMIKTTDIRIRITPEEKEYIKQIAVKRGMTLSDYVRYCILRETQESVINAITKIDTEK